MPETSRFSSLRGLREPEAPAAETPAKQPRKVTAKPPAAKPTPAAISTPRKGSRGGKTSNPDFRPVNLVLRLQTKRDANRRLEDTNDQRDLSELVEDLLTDWLKR